MCLVTFAWRNHDRYRLVLVANRDERFDRASAPLDWWSDHGDILAGRDLVAGGTWLGVSRAGRFAVVTNFREPDPGSGRHSRGELVTNWLASDTDAGTYAARLADTGADYAGFNLLFGDTDALHYASNRAAEAGAVEPGNHALSNAALNTPWPKSLRVLTGLGDALRLTEFDDDVLLPMLQDAEPAADESLPDAHLPLPMRRALSAPFIVGETYGTRCSSVLTLSRDGEFSIMEQQYRPGGAIGERRRFSFQAAG